MPTSGRGGGRGGVGERVGRCECAVAARKEEGVDVGGDWGGRAQQVACQAAEGARAEGGGERGVAAVAEQERREVGVRQHVHERLWVACPRRGPGV